MSGGVPLRVGVDATPLLGSRTGVGHYTARLIEHLLLYDDLALTATAFTLRGAGRLPGLLPAGVRARSRPVPARLLRSSWARTQLPPVELLAGPVDVFHAVNFVLPPLRRAGGVVTIHDLSFVHLGHTVHADSLAYRTLVPRGLARARVVATPSAAVADEVAREYGVHRADIVIAPPGIDPGWFTARPLSASERLRAGLPPVGRYLLAVGTLEPRKNLPRLIQAHGQLWESGRRVPLVLAGGRGWGPALSLQRSPAGSVLLTGYLDDAALRGAVAGAAVLAFPSLYEGFGIPPVEALACGTPVVAADLPVTREVLGDTAALIDPHDTAALREALRSSLDEPGGELERERRRDRARQWTWSRCAEAMHGAYRRAALRTPDGDPGLKAGNG